MAGCGVPSCASGTTCMLQFILVAAAWMIANGEGLLHLAPVLQKNLQEIADAEVLSVPKFLKFHIIDLF